MSQVPTTGGAEPRVVYVPVPTPPPPSTVGRVFSWLLRTFFVLSLLLNLVVLYFVATAESSDLLPERFHSGSRLAAHKIAIVHIDGVIMDGLMGHAAAQLRTAAEDEEVAAVVVAVNSPGGSVTASDVLWKQVKDLKEGKWPNQKRPKPVVISMGGIAASGGYYLAAPANVIFAQPTTITGSIGVYAQLINVAKLAEQHGVEATLLKKGELKGSGSLFKPLTPPERQEFEDLLEHTFLRFQQVVKEGRGTKLKYGLREEFKVKSAADPTVTMVRRIADGGAFTADEALRCGLIDQIGYLEDALAEAKKLGGQPADAYRVVTFNRPFNLLDSLLGLRQTEPTGVELGTIPGATRQMWYLTPGYELAGVKLK